MRQIIWSYWEGPPNPLNDECLKSWGRYMNGWEIRILNDDTVKGYDIVVPTTYDTLSATTKSDVVRLGVLSTFGGLWLDRTILINKPMDDWIQSRAHYPYFGFQVLGNRYIESWFILVPEARNPHIIKWRDTLLDILQTDPVTDHIAYSTGSCTSRPAYFMIYQAFCHCLTSDAEFLDVFKSIPFIRQPHFYSPFHPLHGQPGILTKFTKHGRWSCINIPFPYIYGILSIAILVIILIILIILAIIGSCRDTCQPTT